MTLGQILTGFKTLCEDIAGVPPELDADEVEAPVDGEEQAGHVPASTSGVLVKVKPMRSKALGEDEIRQTYVPGTTNDPPGPGIGDGKAGFTRVSFGNRILTFKITVSQDDGGDDGLAFPIAENIRSRLHLPTNLERLHQIHLGICEFSDIEDTTEVEDDRAYPAVFFLAVFNAAVSYEDTPIESIETVNTEYVEPES